MRALHLLSPLPRSALNLIRSRPKLPGILVGLGTLGFLVAVHVAVARLLGLMDEVPMIGVLLKNYLLSATLLCLLPMLAVSALVNSLSSLFLSRDLDLLVASPTPYRAIFTARFVEILLRSSWMVGLLLAPVMTAYGTNYHAGFAFHLLWPPLLLPFLVIATALGILLALVVGATLPVRRAASVLKFLFVVGVGLMVVLMRVLQPEQLVQPDRFESFGRFLMGLHSPWATDLPNFWLAHLLIAAMNWDDFGVSRFALPYGATTVVVLLVTWFAARRLHLFGWRRFRDAGGGRVAGAGTALSSRLLAWAGGLVARRSPAAARLMEKEALVFARTPAIWTQIALLGVIVIIYVYNIRLLPAEALANLRSDLPVITAWCNVGFIAFIITAAALRFGFPAVSMEGPALRLVLSSPVSTRTYMAVKYWCSALPLGLLAGTLAAGSSWMLDSAPLVTAIAVIDSLVLSQVIAALALLFGVLYADLDTANVAELPSGWGGMLFMLLAILVTGAFLTLQAWPCYVHFLASTSIYRPPAADTALAWTLMAFSLGLAAALVVTARRAAVRRLPGLA